VKKIYTKIEQIAGPIAEIKGATDIGNREIAQFTGFGMGQVIKINRENVVVQSLKGTLGMSTRQNVYFLGHEMTIPYDSRLLLGRRFSGIFEPLDGKPHISSSRQISVQAAIINPTARDMASGYIQTGIPGIDGTNTIVRSQKIPIFKRPEENVNKVLGRIITQSEVNDRKPFVVIFGGMGLKYEEYLYFDEVLNQTAERSLMIVNLASESSIERLNVPPICCTIAEQMALEGKHVFIILSDMLNFANALMEVANAQEKIPARAGYPGDLYTQLARVYERAVNFGGNLGSSTILSVTSVPNGDITHPVADLTGYITEGQIFIKHGKVSILDSLSRLKKLVIAKETREDHAAIMDACVRAYAYSLEIKEKLSMGLEITSEVDKLYLKFGDLFEEHFLPVHQNRTMDETLDLGWDLISILPIEEIGIRKEFVNKYYKSSSEFAAA
jgi:V/A-type H+-transporting ATPase subunit B